MNVTAIRESDWDKKDGTPVVKVTEVTLEDGSKAPGYDLPQIPEIGKPLPDGWEFATGKSGKPYIKVPKAGKGAPPQAAFRNTKEGQAVEQERMDRRTALMQAVAYGMEAWPDALERAENFYTWLRETSGAAPPADRNAGVTTAPKPSPGKSAEASPVDATPASLPATTHHLAGVGGAGDSSDEPHGEGGSTDGERAGAEAGSSAPAPSNYLTREEQKTFAKAFGGQVAAIDAARGRFGTRVRGLDDLTREMATELAASKVGG